MDVVTHYEIYQYTLSYHPPFPNRNGFLLHLIHKDKEGWGEIAPLPGRNRETLAQAIEQLLYILRDLDAPLPSLFPSVSFGLFSALNYQPAKQALPLCALLAGTVEQILKKAEIAFREGFTCAKVKISGLPLHIIPELIHHLRKQFTLRIDANRAFSFKEAMQICSNCKEYDFDYIEEPIYELDQLKNFSYPFALDESLLELDQLPITSHLKSLVFKPSVMGADRECLSYARNHKIIFSSACETGVGILGIASLAASLPVQLNPLGLDTYRFLNRDILCSPLDFYNGNLLLPDVIHVDTKQLKAVAHS
jgi:O-succinylbenzoate synthase